MTTDTLSAPTAIFMKRFFRQRLAVWEGQKKKKRGKARAITESREHQREMVRASGSVLDVKHTATVL